MAFKPEELAAMAAADAEIESTFRMTREDMEFSRLLDRQAVLNGMDHGKRKLAERQRAYREANRDKVAEYQRAYYEANRDKVAERQRAYREANRDKLAEYQRAYYEANRDKVAERQRAYREANRDKVAERQAIIRDARKAHGYTQQMLATLLGISKSRLSQWETGYVPADWELLRKVLPELT